MDALEALKTRRSVRSFTSDEVSKEVIEDLVDCGRLAATARNDQPWAFVVVRDAAVRKQLAGIADYGAFIADAPVCIVVLCKPTKYYIEDGSAATQNVLLAAHAHGLGACWVAGDKKPYAAKVRDVVGAPNEFCLLSMVAVGYPAGQGQPPKRALSEVLHWDAF